jgi:transposase
MFEVKRLLAEGQSVSAISRTLGMDRKTVRKLAGATMVPKRQDARRRPSKLDPHVDYLERRLADGVTNATRLEMELRERGYTGKHTILRAWVAQHRPPRAKTEPVVRFETEPGQQAQVDWADCGPVLLDGTRGRLMAFMFVLGYSRMAYVEFGVGRDLGHLLRAHQHAFDALGGVPEEILYDNERTITGGRGADGRPRWQSTFYDFATTYGFRPDLCRPYRPQTKGKVERFIGYLRTSFLEGRRAETLGQLNADVTDWLARVANVRIHATTGVPPMERWPEERLLPLAGQTYDTSVWSERRVSRDGLVSYLGNRYSVPWTLSGRAVRVQETPVGKLLIWQGSRTVVEHDLRTEKGRVIVVPGHLALRPPPEPSRGQLRLLDAPTVAARSLHEYEALAQAEASR